MLSIDILNLVKYDNVKNISSKDYLSEDEYAYHVFDTKYCIRWDELGEVITDTSLPYFKIETPADVFWRVSSGLAAMESTEELQKHYRDAWFALLWLGWFRPGGSVLSGVGAPVVKSLLNCTTLPLSEDSLEGINQLDYDIMKCAAFRQGLGFDGSILRPRGAKVNNAAEESTGAVPWIMKLVDNGEYVGQKGRKPAILVSLKDHHPDIVEFICSKSEKGVLEDANISIQISNAFIDAVEKDIDWELYYEFSEGSKYSRISKVIKAKYLFDLIAEKAFSTAEPGVQYIDLLREGSMVHQIYMDTADGRFKIISTNACCFTDENQLLTDKGNLTIRELMDRIAMGESFNALSKNLDTKANEFKPIVDVFERENGIPVQTVTLNLANGKSIECTPDHKFFTTNRGIVMAKDLTTDDDLEELI